MSRLFKNIDTGEIFTLEELTELYDHYQYEMVRYDYDADSEVPKYENFDEYLNYMLTKGANGTGGLIEITGGD